MDRGSDRARKETTWDASPSSLIVSLQARISPVRGTTARWSLRQSHLPRVPCVWASHSPAMHLQPGRVDHDVHRPARLGPRQRRGGCQPRTAPQERRVLAFAPGVCALRNRSPRRLLGARPDDQAWHANVAAHRLTPIPANGPKVGRPPESRQPGNTAPSAYAGVAKIASYSFSR